MVPEQRRTLVSEGALTVGFLALAAGVVGAHLAPVARYEPSLYAGTPLSFWLGVAAAAGIAILVALSSRQRGPRLVAALLCGGSVLAVATLPVIRGYYFYGTGDALTHLGWARDLAAEQLGTTDLFYPALHSLSVLYRDVLGLPLPQSMLLVVVGILVVFVVFVPLCVGAATDAPSGPLVGAFAALLLLPINHVAFHYLNPHPVSEAIFLSPLVLYLAVRYLDGDAGPSVRGVSTVGLLFALSLSVTVLYHSMQAGNLLAVLGSVAILQVVAQRYGTGRGVGRRTVYAHLGLLAVVFVVWNVRFSVVVATMQATGRSVAGLLYGSAEAGAVVSQRSASLSDLGIGLPEIFLKLFVPSALFLLLSLWVVVVGFARWDDRSLTGVRLLGSGAVGLVLFTLLFVAGNVSKLVFRNLGFAMVLATILGSIAVARQFPTEGSLGSTSPGSASVTAVAVALCLVLSTLVIFPSPYIYQPNGGVTESESAGYEQAFELRDRSVAFAGIRSGPQRQVQGIYGRNGVPDDLDEFGYFRSEGRIDGTNLTGLSGAVDRQRYLIVTDRDKVRETVAYRSLRYTEGQIDAVDDQRGVGRVLTNGQVRLYHVTPVGG